MHITSVTEYEYIILIQIMPPKRIQIQVQQLGRIFIEITAFSDFEESLAHRT